MFDTIWETYKKMIGLPSEIEEEPCPTTMRSSELRKFMAQPHDELRREAEAILSHIDLPSWHFEVENGRVIAWSERGDRLLQQGADQCHWLHAINDILIIEGNRANRGF